jgi:hypothetical protein
VHAAENAGAGDLTLNAGELRMIEQALPLGAEPDSLPML